jgi:hypothetical protein
MRLACCRSLAIGRKGGYEFHLGRCEVRARARARDPGRTTAAKPALYSYSPVWSRGVAQIVDDVADEGYLELGSEFKMLSARCPRKLGPSFELPAPEKLQPMPFMSR